MIVRGGTHQIYSTYHLTLGAIRFKMNRPQNFFEQLDQSANIPFFGDLSISLYQPVTTI